MKANMRVTFDTNTLDRVSRPERFPKDPHQAIYAKVRAALESGRVKGYFCETLVTLEGIQKVDRAAVFASTSTRQQRTVSVDAETGESTVRINLFVEQPERKPLHPENLARIQAALHLGMQVLAAPRIGFVRIDDPGNAIYANDSSEDDLSKRLDKYHDAARAIQSRGLGFAQVEALSKHFAKRDNVSEPWFKSLPRAKNVHEENAVKRAVAEWADGDSVAAHIGYAIDIFCTGDQGQSAGGSSVFDGESRTWLATTYGVQFRTLSELSEEL